MPKASQNTFISPALRKRGGKKKRKKIKNTPRKQQDPGSSPEADALPNPEMEETTLHSLCTQDTTNHQGLSMEGRR